MRKSPATSALPAAVPGASQALAPTRLNGELIPGFGNVTRQDLIIPRIKLLQGLSPEVQNNPRQFFSGEYYHSALGEMLGKEMVIVPLQVQRTIELWAPRDDDQGLLARSLDGIHWDKPNTKFEVRLRGGKKAVWDTKANVEASGLAEFGSSEPGNPKSAPIASLTYRLALFLVDKPELGPSLMIVSKTSTKSVQDLISRIHLRHLAGVPFHLQKYQMGVVKKTNGPNEFFNPVFHNAGNVTENGLAASLRDMATAMAQVTIKAADEVPDEEAAVRPSQAGHAAF